MSAETCSTNSPVRLLLEHFADAYLRRDPNEAEAFVLRTFVPDDRVTIVGTAAAEYSFGKKAAVDMFRGDWDGWADVCFDAGSAKIEADENVAQFDWTGTLKQSFEHTQERYARYRDSIRNTATDATTAPLAALGHLVWLFALTYHEREPGVRTYAWPLRLTGMVERTGDSSDTFNGWRFRHLHFSLAVEAFPDVCFGLDDGFRKSYDEELTLLSAKATPLPSELHSALERLETSKGMTLLPGVLLFERDHAVVAPAGDGFWLIMTGVVRNEEPSDSVASRVLAAIDGLLAEGDDTRADLFRAHRLAAGACRILAAGDERVYPVRLSAMIRRTRGELVLQNIHFALPFYWYLEGKVDDAV